MTNEINARIAYYRKAAGLTQNVAAQMLGMKRNTYARMELHGNPRPEILKEIAELYHVSVDQILYGENAAKQNKLFESVEPEKPQMLHSEPDSELYSPPIFIPTSREIKLIQIYRALDREKKTAFYEMLDELYRSSEKK